jgi:serine/threonine protein kinase
MEEENDLIGQQIGNYRLIEEIASGSFGTVYRAHHHILTDRIVALKVLHLHLPARERERFIQEARFLGSLGHRHILSIVDVGFDNGRPYLASTYASGGSLRQRLDQKRLLPFDQVLTILTQVGEALHYAHQQNIVHCDLKPENILFNAQGEAVLADFGIATVLSTMSFKQLASPEGTPSYMAPEQFHGQVSKETDQYALGCIAYELVTGQRVFSAPNFVAMGFQHMTEQPIPPHQINTQIPIHVEQAILKALAKQRSNRHKDIAAFLSALQTSMSSSLSPSISSEDLTTPNSIEQKGKDARFLYRQAIKLLRFKLLSRINIRKTLATLQRIVVQNMQNKMPNAPQTTKGEWLASGNALFNLKRYEEALFAYEQALSLDPNFAVACYNKGNVLYNLKRYEEALEAFKQALRVNPDHVYAYNGKGNALRNLKRHEEALEAYEQALRLDPNFAGIYNGKGNALRDLKRHEEALEAYKQALRLDPNYTAAYNNKAITLYDLKQYEEALMVCEQALYLDPNFAAAYNNKSLILDRLGRMGEAQQAREKARKLGLD